MQALSESGRSPRSSRSSITASALPFVLPSFQPSALQNWLKEETKNTEPPTLADYIQGILSRKAQTGKSGYSQSLYNLKDAAKMLNFLQANNIMDMTGLDEKFKSMIGEQLDIQGKLKPVERRLATLKKQLEQADIYFKYKGKKPPPCFQTFVRLDKLVNKKYVFYDIE